LTEQLTAYIIRVTSVPAELTAYIIRVTSVPEELTAYHLNGGKGKLL
jgi:hypothetical protein